MTPPRVAFLDGEVMFWRPGAGDWEAAQLNIPLAGGDSLATRSGKLELQIGAKSFVRAGDDTQLRVQSNEPDFLQLEVSAGHVSVDLRDLRRGTAVRVDTPNGAVAIAHEGYYRIDVDPNTTRVIVRRGGQATVTPAGGSTADLATGEAVEITGTGDAHLTALAAPPFDDWDRWNYDRVDRLLAAPRSYAMSDDVYGGAELEEYGNWRYANTYGRVWVPNAVPTGWAPYTDGRWLWDPLYGWSWVDYAPWGWAPFHYGRWVYAGYWAWAPGPVLAAPVYSPALVAFFGAPGFSVGFSVGLPVVSWVPLGWGEPLIPWWGPVGFIGTPCWWGWGGPHIVNNIVINNTDVVHANTVNFYRNMNAPGGLVGVPKNQFDSHSLDRVRVTNFNRGELQPVHGALPVAAKSGAPGKMPIPDVAGHRPFGGTAQNPAATNFGRSGQPGSSPNTAFGRQGAPGFGAQSSSTAPGSKGGVSGAFDALRARGPGALTAPSRSDPGKGAAPATGASNFGRGQSPPPLPGSGKSATSSTFDALRRGNSSAPAGNFGRSADPNKTGAPATGSSNFGRGQSPPPLPGSGKGAATGTFDALRRGNSAPAAGNFGRSAPPPAGSTNLRRTEAPPLPRGYAKPGSSTAPVRMQNAPAAPQFERRAETQSAAPAAPAWPKGRIAAARPPQGAFSRPAQPNTGGYRAPSVRTAPSANLRSFSSNSGGARSAPSGAAPRGGGSLSNFSRSSGMSGGGHGGGKLGR